MKSPDFEAQVPALLRQAAQTNPARAHDHLPALQRSLVATYPRTVSHVAARSRAGWRRTGAIAGAFAIIAVAALLFTHLPRPHVARPVGATPLEVSAQQAWGSNSINSFVFDTQFGTLQPSDITPDGRMLVILNTIYPCPNPCPPGTDVTAMGVDTFSVPRHTLQGLYLEHGVPGFPVTDGRYIVFWQGIPGVAPHYKGMEIRAIDLTTGEVCTLASVSFTTGNDQTALTYPLIDHGVVLWGQQESDDPQEQHLYLMNLATGVTHLIAPHVVQSFLYWPYIVYKDGTNAIFVHDVQTNATRSLTQVAIPGAVRTFYTLNSTTLTASATVETAKGFQVQVQGLDLTRLDATWQPIVTAVSSGDAVAEMNDRLAVWTDTDHGKIEAWDRLQHRLVVLASSKKIRLGWQGGAIKHGHWLVLLLPMSGNVSSETVEIIDTAALPK